MKQVAIIWFCLLIGCCKEMHAQSVNEFKQIGVNDGLSQNSVHDIYQDKKGFLWIATADGLNRYDGLKFKVYKHRYGDTSKHNLPSDFIVGGFAEDEHECLWFFTESALVKMDMQRNTFQQVLPLDENSGFNVNTYIRTAVFKNGYIWMFTKGKRLFKIHTKTLEKTTVELPIMYESVRYDAQHEKLFMFTGDGVYTFNFEQQQPLRKIINDSISFITIFDANQYVVLKNNTVSLYNTQTNVSVPLPGLDNYPNGAIGEMLLWKQQALFIVVPGKGMLRYDLASKKITEYKNVPGDLGTLSVNFLRKFYVDDSDNLWLGTEGGGLSKLDLKQRKFNCYPAGVYNIPNPANMMVKSLYARGTKIYAGTFSKGLYIIDTITNEASVVNILKKSTQDNDAPITAMLNDSRNRIWIGCGNYIGFIHAATGQFEKFDTIDAKNGFIYSIYEHSPDTLLIGTYKRVFRVVVDKNHNVHVDKENVFNNPEITGLIQSIVKGPGNSVYIGTIEHGFKKCVVQGDNLVIKAQGMSNTGVRHFYNDVVNQIMWIATDNGLLAYNDSTGEYSLFDERQGLSNGHIYAILPESDNVLWISNNKGLNRIRFDKNELGEVRITTVKQFNQKSGLQSNEFNSGAYFAYNRKHLMFGGVSGVNWFNTENVVSNHHIPQVVLTGLMVNEKRYLTPIDYPFLKKLELPYYNNSVYLNYAALEFTNPVLNKYVYKMEGGENIWVEGSNEVRFSNLEPGSYKFLVKAANNDGVWSDEQLLLEIKIIPPFWGTWWFKTLMAVLLTMAMIGLGHYLVKRSVRKKTRELEMQQVLNEERNRISRDMHDEMGTGLTKISLLTEVARHINQQDRDKSLQTLKDISVTSRGLTQKMGEIIWMLSPVNDTLDSLAAYLKEYVYNITDSLNIDVVTDFPENIPAIKLSHDKRRQLLLVTKEALHNALKHAAATQISFSMDIHKHGFLLMMNDNGKGLTNETSEKTGNGLKNMAWRMEQIGGVFKIESESGNGTTVIYGIQDL